MFTALLFIALAYLLGSINSAIIVCKIMGLPDPRSEGSGNPGATNVMRVGGKQAAAIVFVADALKGFVAVLLAHWFDVAYFPLGLVALAVVVGHCYSLYYNFEGGKGVATAFGALLALSFSLALVALIVWLAVVAVTRYVSLAGVLAAVAAALVTPFVAPTISYFLPVCTIALIILWRHMDNLSRISEHKERKLGG